MSVRCVWCARAECAGRREEARPGQGSIAALLAINAGS